MKGYKAFNRNLKCRGFQYEIGRTYEIKGKIQICQKGFHFCETIPDCYQYYSRNYETRICEVEALGEIQKRDNKFCTNKIRIIREITDLDLVRCNAGRGNSGYQNIGLNNSSFCNSGDWNSGNFNSSNRNVGSYNTGSNNVGNCNGGRFNTGCCNAGDCNTGDFNSGHYNTGDFNSCSHSTGIFNTKESTIKIFNKESDWTYQNWIDSEAYYIMEKCPRTVPHWVRSSDMTDEERESHPVHETTGGFLKVNPATAQDKQEWWDNLPEKDKKSVMSLPNFDADIFYKCTEIRVQMES